MRKKILFVVVNLVFSFLVVIIIGEVCFRMFRGAPNPAAEVSQKTNTSLFVPNSKKDGKSSVEGEFEYIANYNKYGYRGADFAMPKKDGTLRIMALGDSMTYGVGVNDDETIPYYLEQKLQAKNLPVEVINGGSGHAGTIKHYMNLNNFHLKYNPDMVLLLFDLTDLQDDWYVERHARYSKDGEIVGLHPLYINGKRDWWLTAVHHSAFAKYIHDKIVRSYRKWRILGGDRYRQAKKEGKRAKAVIIESNDIEDEVVFQYDYLLFMRGKRRAELINKQWERTSKYILKIRDLLANEGIPMMMVVYPHGIYVGADEWNEGRATWGFEKNKLYTDYYAFNLMEEFAKENKIPFANALTDFLKAKGDEPLFFEWDGHMYPAGYEVVADSINKSSTFQKLLARSLAGIIKK